MNMGIAQIALTPTPLSNEHNGAHCLPDAGLFEKVPQTIEGSVYTLLPLNGQWGKYKIISCVVPLVMFSQKLP